jgi:hypothetical protein
MVEIQETVRGLKSRLWIQQELAARGHADGMRGTFRIMAQSFQREAAALLALPCPPELKRELREIEIDAALLEASAA